ncbi:MAG: hypothetical protein NDI77_03340 [Geobacteraceae bacterium]|nr:hypothetical protein [Geobacteraceae bacterium]
MPYPSVRKFTALLLMVMILAVSGFCPGQESRAAETLWGAAAQAAACDAGGAGADHCPSCPDSGQSETDSCASSCYCSCHLPVTGLPFQLKHTPVISELVFFEPFTALPEVYLPKFIPPQNLA